MYLHPQFQGSLILGHDNAIRDVHLDIIHQELLHQ